MAAELSDRIERAAPQIEVSWSEDRAANILQGVYRQKRRQKQWRAGVAAAAVLGLLALSPRLVSPWTHGSAARLASAPTTHTVPPELLPDAGEVAPLRLRDGSLVRAQSRTSQLRVREETPRRTVVELLGAARFDVVHDPQRVFRVETSGLAVEVLGTQFVVEELLTSVRVTVQQGRVRVLWSANYEELAAGQSALYPRQPTEHGATAGTLAQRALPPLSEAAPAAAPPHASAAIPAAAGDSAPTPPRAGARRTPQRGERATPPSVAAPAVTLPALPSSEPPSWQALAHEGQFEQAYRITYGPPDDAAGTHHGAATPLLRERDMSPGDLLLLADVARLSHHPADAVAPLSRLLREHAGDPRAPLAAFSLGRVLLDDLGRPREAAQSFLRAQQLDLDGPLSQDALAREVEAWSRAGEGQSARARALQYIQKYPTGRRLRSVRHFGELL